MKSAKRYQDIGIGLFAAGFAALVLIVWIPLDIDTGIIDEWRRTVRIGDAMLPTFAAIGIVAAGIGIVIQSFFNSSQIEIHKINLMFFCWFVLIFVIALGLMFVTGPLAIWLWTGGEISYRYVYGSAPWKYLGFMVGGFFLTFGLMSLAYKRLNWFNLWTAIAAVFLIAMAFSLPSESMLIPPNREF